jgi:hypothetical protein
MALPVQLVVRSGIRAACSLRVLPVFTISTSPVLGRHAARPGTHPFRRSPVFGVSESLSVNQVTRRDTWPVAPRRLNAPTAVS